MEIQTKTKINIFSRYKAKREKNILKIKETQTDVNGDRNTNKEAHIQKHSQGGKEQPKNKTDRETEKKKDTRETDRKRAKIRKTDKQSRKT